MYLLTNCGHTLKVTEITIVGFSAKATKTVDVVVAAVSETAAVVSAVTEEIWVVSGSVTEAVAGNNSPDIVLPQTGSTLKTDNSAVLAA